MTEGSEVKTVPLIQPNGEKTEPKTMTETPAVAAEEKIAIEAKAATKEEPVKVETGNEPTKKFFEEEWKEHFGDETPENVKTYKTKVSEYETKLKDLESSKVEFANDRIKQLNELAKQGIDIDEKTVAFLNKDYTKIENPIDGLAEFLKMKNPTWTDKKIDFELRQKYRLDNLKVEEGEEMTEAQKEIEEIAKEDIDRDWKEAQKELLERQDKIRLVKPKPQAEIDAEKKSAEEAEKNWEETVKKISGSKNKLKVEFSEETQKQMNGGKEKISPFEYELSKDKKAAADKIFHSMGKDPNSFWNLFADKNGSLNNDESREKIYDFVQSYIAKDEFVQKLAETQYKNALEFSIKTDKKISMEPNKASQGAKTVKLPVIQPRN